MDAATRPHSKSVRVYAVFMSVTRLLRIAGVLVGVSLGPCSGYLCILGAAYFIGEARVLGPL